MLRSNLSLALNYNLDDFTTKNLFMPTIDKFLQFQLGIANEYRILEAEVYISSHDFRFPHKAPMEHIYLNLLNGVNRVGKLLDIPISIFITFDRRQCPNYCKDSARFFSSIKVGGVSKIYYILFTTDELFSFLYFKETGSANEINENITSTENFDSEICKNKDLLEDIKITIETNYIKGFLDNHNLEIGLSYISCTDNSGYPIYHRDFPSIRDVAVGSILDIKIDNSTKIGKVSEYSLSEDKEIEGLIQFFDGVLQRRGFNAYINTDFDKIKTIFVPSNIARNFEDYNYTRVTCLARYKQPIEKDQYGWIALQVVENIKIIR